MHNFIVAGDHLYPSSRGRLSWRRCGKFKVEVRAKDAVVAWHLGEKKAHAIAAVSDHVILRAVRVKSGQRIVRWNCTTFA